MDINLTLFGEMITFAVLIFVTVKFIWPPVVKAMQDRQKKIADGLAAAERGQHSLDVAQKNAKSAIREAKEKAKTLIEQAHQEENKIIETSKETAQKENAKILSLGRVNLEQEKALASQALQKQATELAMQAAQKILASQVNAKVEQQLFDQFIADIED